MEQNNPKSFLGINWTVRFNNPQFWLGIALSILVPPLAYTGTEFSEVTSWGKFFAILGEGFKNPYIVLMMLVSIYNAVVDNTTKGLSDSYIAKQYLRPRTDKDPRYALDWEVNVDKKADEKFDAHRTDQQETKQSEETKEQTDVVDDVEAVDGINGTEISDGDVRDEIELNNQTAEDTFSNADNEIFGDSAQPQDIGNDDEESFREKQADADIKGEEIKG